MKMNSVHINTGNPVVQGLLRRFLAATTLFACLGAVHLSAATLTLASEDFEGYTGGATSLADTSDADPVIPTGQINDDDPLGSPAGSGVQLINWLAHSGTNSLLIRANAAAQLNLPNARTGSRYQLDYWVYVVRQPTSSQNFYLQVRGMGTDLNGDDFVAFQANRATNSTVLRYYDGVRGAAAWVNTTANQAPDAWQHHRLIMDPLAMTWDLYVDDVQVLNDADLSRGEVPMVTALLFTNEGNTADDGYFAIDDVVLTIDDYTADLSTPIVEGFESYAPRVNVDDDADPTLPWVINEQAGTGAGKEPAPARVQVVDSSVVTPRSGTKCLKLEGGQRAGATVAWGVPPEQDVQITWWARVPASVDGTVATYLRMSLYGAENGNTIAGDNALLGYGSRDTTVGDDTSLTIYTGPGWFDTGFDYTPDQWEQYRLITHTALGRYSIIKNPDGPSPQIIADRLAFIAGLGTYTPIMIAAWSSSNGTGHPPVYIDDIEIRSLTSAAEPISPPYSVVRHTDRFTNVTVLTVDAAIGDMAVDPRDNSTIVFLKDSAPGGIYKATKVSSGNWAVDPTPIVTDLDRPSGLAIDNAGTLWWTHDFSMALARLKAPWSANTPELVVTNFGNAVTDDDPIDLTVAPQNFSGRPGWIVVADRGSDGDVNNALNLVDPATTEINTTNNTFLVEPGVIAFGDKNLNAITSLPQSGEVVALTGDGYITAVNGTGAYRWITPTALWSGVLAPDGTAAAIAADPTTGRLWIADETADEIWSVASDGGSADVKEVTFQVTSTFWPELKIDYHEPGMAFAPDGSFLVVSDMNARNGLLVILHNEPIARTIDVALVAKTPAGVELSWSSAGAGAVYRVQRTTSLATAFQDVSGDLTATQYTDTNPPADAAFYRIWVKP